MTVYFCCLCQLWCLLVGVYVIFVEVFGAHVKLWYLVDSAVPVKTCVTCDSLSLLVMIFAVVNVSDTRDLFELLVKTCFTCDDLCVFGDFGMNCACMMLYLWCWLWYMLQSMARHFCSSWWFLDLHDFGFTWECFALQTYFQHVFTCAAFEVCIELLVLLVLLMNPFFNLLCYCWGLHCVTHVTCVTCVTFAA